jgi:thioredoxin-dependent peroxiredoxin
MIGIGDKVPDFQLRTDEGTPLSLPDLKGRGTAVFLLGTTFTPTVERLFEVLARNVERFLALDISPIAVLGESVDSLAGYRSHNDVPFLLISDDKLHLHGSLGHGKENAPMVWLIDKTGTVIDMLPMLPPSELISVAVDRAARLTREKNIAPAGQ